MILGGPFHAARIVVNSYLVVVLVVFVPFGGQQTILNQLFVFLSALREFSGKVVSFATDIFAQIGRASSGGIWGIQPFSQRSESTMNGSPFCAAL